MRILAYFDSSHDMPEEIIIAAGFTPMKIMGDVHQPNDPADQYLQKFFCPAARSFLTQALAQSAQWAGIVVAHGCDATNRHYDVWKRHVQTPFLYWFNSPIRNDDIAKRFYIAELKRLIAALEKHFNISISHDNLKSAIAQSNEIKIRLKTIAALRSTKDISNSEYFNTIVACLTKPKNECIDLLKQIEVEWKNRPPFPQNKKRFYLTGSDITYVEWMELLDECSIRIVRDDLSIGERYFTTTIPEGNDPLEAIAEYYLTIPRPATKISLDGRIEFIVNSLRETPVDAVLSQNLKFCEPYAYDAVPVNNELRKRGFKVLHLEREFTPLFDQQVINRISAFREML
ncbi:MAG: 2-hydroxyacyl-CoA dehydratase family protein [Spirochaetes bacterium]|nr:2-hydroxyacyl-CoA dehydratase family protein [Spirochaetota bacterium]